MVLDRIFPKITGFYLDGSPSEAEIVYSDKVRRAVENRLCAAHEKLSVDDKYDERKHKFAACKIFHKYP